MTNSISAFYVASMQPPPPTNNTTNAAVSEQDFLARVEAFERNEEREARRAIALMKRLVAQDSRSSNVTPAGALSNSAVPPAVTQSRQPPPVPQVPSLSSSAHSSPPPTIALATPTSSSFDKRRPHSSSISTDTFKTGHSSIPSITTTTAIRYSTGSHANLSPGPSSSTHINHSTVSTTLTNSPRPSTSSTFSSSFSSFKSPSVTTPSEVIHLTRGSPSSAKDKDASSSISAISPISNSSSREQRDRDHKAQTAGTRRPPIAPSTNSLPDAYCSFPHSSSSTEFAQSHLRPGPSSYTSSSSASLSSNSSSALLRPSDLDLGSREKKAVREYGCENGSAGSGLIRVSAAGADGQRGTQRHSHVHRASTTSLTASSRATSAHYHPVVPPSRHPRGKESSRPAASTTAALPPPSRVSSSLASPPSLFPVPVMVIAGTEDDRLRSSLQRSRRSSTTVTLEYNLKTDSALQPYRQRVDSRASLSPSAAAMNVKKKAAAVASATPTSTRTTKDRIFAKSPFTPPQQPKLVLPLYA